MGNLHASMTLVLQYAFFEIHNNTRAPHVSEVSCDPSRKVPQVNKSLFSTRILQGQSTSKDYLCILKFILYSVFALIPTE